MHHSLRKQFLCGLFLCVFLASLPSSPGRAEPAVCAAAIQVTSSADSGAGTLRQALLNLCVDGTVTFASDLTILLSTPLAINNPLTIDGAPHTIILSGGGTARIAAVTNPSGTVTLKNLSMNNGKSAGNGGAISNNGRLALDSVVFNNNTAVEFGGAVITFASTELTIVNSAFYNNSAANGGALYNFGSLSVSNSYFYQNQAAPGDGGAIYNDFINLTVDNSTFDSNSAAGNGGSIFNKQGAALVINSFFYHGAALAGGGFATTVDGSFQIKNSMLLSPLGGGNCSGGINAASHNLSSDATCGTGFTQSPSMGIGTLASYGGVTPVFPLLPGSPAIDAGLNCPSADQRGLGGVGACDIGPFEAQGFTLSIDGGDGQSASVLAAFASPLALTISANHPGDPVDGGEVIFSAPGSGASAVITGGPAAISGGGASVTAVANSNLGTYTVSASASGANPQTFTLHNVVPAAFVPLISR